jgi:hypothetical protein
LTLIAMRSVEAPGGSFGVKTAAELLLSRLRAIVSQRPPERRCSWTVHPANERAPATRVAKRCLASVRIEMAGLTAIVLVGLMPPSQIAV